MNKKHPKESKSAVNSSLGSPQTLNETDRKKLELGDAMEHKHGQTRENTEEDIESLDKKKRAG